MPQRILNALAAQLVVETTDEERAVLPEVVLKPPELDRGLEP
jgi:hypothetical protein